MKKIAAVAGASSIGYVLVSLSDSKVKLHYSESSFLKEKIENLETKIEDQKSLILDSKSTNIGCSTQCIVF